jgi:hypothetical protein
MAKVGKVKPALRMSQPSTGLDKADEALLNEDEDDWVQMRIIEGLTRLKLRGTEWAEPRGRDTLFAVVVTW